MKVDFSKILNDLDDQPVMLEQPAKKEGDKLVPQPAIVLTLRKVATDALYANFSDELHLPGEEKMKRHVLARRIHKETKEGLEVDLTPEEITQVKLVVGKLWGTAAVGPAYEILNG